MQYFYLFCTSKFCLERVMFRKNYDNNIGVRPVLGFLIDKG